MSPHLPFFFQRLAKKKSQSPDCNIAALRALSFQIKMVCVRSFFSDLLISASPFDSSARDYILSKVFTRLSPVQNTLCEGLLRQESVSLPLRVLLTTPGCDVFLLNSTFTSGLSLALILFSTLFSLPVSCLALSVAVTLSFLQKGGGGRLDPRNWRPHTLLNVDYEIASRSISARSLKVICVLVRRDQNCGVPGLFNGQNVPFIADVVD